MDAHSQDPWTEAQWIRVRETVRDEAKQQRVAASFLPVHGPLSRETQTAPLQDLPAVPLFPPPGTALEVDDFTTRRLTTLSVHVALRAAQVVEPGLSSALLAFRRAANLIARTEDWLVFRHQLGVSMPPNIAGLAPCYIRGGAAFPGLLDTALATPQNVAVPGGPLNPTGPGLVTAVSRGISVLEQQGHMGPFALALGTLLYDTAYSPNFSLVLPSDRIKPILDGPLVRSSSLNRFLGGQQRASGVLVSLAEDLVDLVVASEIDVHLLQVTDAVSPRYVFRVSERFALRIKQRRALVALV